jgi:hypothetical protein
MTLDQHVDSSLVRTSDIDQHMPKVKSRLAGLHAVHTSRASMKSVSTVSLPGILVAHESKKILLVD